MNKGINDNPPRICQTEIEGDSTSCKVNRAGVNFPVSFTSVLLESVPVFLFSNPTMETSLTRFTFLPDKDLPMNGKIVSLEFSCSLEISEIR